ncbi:FAD-dependent monooxygenase [Nonomuraea sp. NPDC050536]|uniref:FAD-dependent monooxygenase n=1 Tax=Nonomuraea sp. NPDC050536 TaxID=3364366 RepID=UPI0037CA0EE0
MALSRREVQGWHKQVGELLDATPGEAVPHVEINDLDPLSTYVHGRVVLLGAAAHAVTPDMGQGACQAIEDAATAGDLSGPAPVIMLGHRGVGGKEGLIANAAGFAQAGFAAFAIHCHSFGDSGGEDRGVIWPEKQVEDCVHGGSIRGRCIPRRRYRLEHHQCPRLTIERRRQCADPPVEDPLDPPGGGHEAHLVLVHPLGPVRWAAVSALAGSTSVSGFPRAWDSIPWRIETCRSGA